MLEPDSHFFISARLRLHYASWGNPDAPTLLLLHGGMDHCRTWDWLANELLNRYRIIAMDLRGHGDSDWAIGNAYSMSDYVYDVSELVKQLNLSDFSIIGHSLGGAIALKYSGLFPEKVRRLVAIEGMGPSPKKLAVDVKKTADVSYFEWQTKMDRLKKRAPDRPGFDSLESAMERMRRSHHELSDERIRHLTMHACRQNERSEFVWKADPYIRAGQPYDMTSKGSQQLWSSISCPVLLLCGENSWASNPADDGRDQYFRHARVLSIPDAGHWLHHDQFELFTSAVSSFLDD